MVSVGCSTRGVREDEAVLTSLSQKTESAMVAKLDLPHCAPNGLGPEAIRDRYQKRLAEGNTEAASECLDLIRSVMDKEGGLYSSVLSELAIAALQVSPDADFATLLVRQLPQEEVMYQNPDTSTAHQSRVINFVVGESGIVLRAVPALAAHVILTELNRTDLSPRYVCLMLHLLSDLPPRWGWTPTLLRVLYRYRLSQEMVEYFEVQLIEPCFREGLDPKVPVNFNAIADATESVSSDDVVRVAWLYLNEYRSSLNPPDDREISAVQLLALVLDLYGTVKIEDFERWRSLWAAGAPNRLATPDAFKAWLKKWQPVFTSEIILEGPPSEVMNGWGFVVVKYHDRGVRIVASQQEGRWYLYRLEVLK